MRRFQPSGRHACCFECNLAFQADIRRPKPRAQSARDLDSSSQFTAEQRYVPTREPAISGQILDGRNSGRPRTHPLSKSSRELPHRCARWIAARRAGDVAQHSTKYPLLGPPPSRRPDHMVNGCTHTHRSVKQSLRRRSAGNARPPRRPRSVFGPTDASPTQGFWALKQTHHTTTKRARRPAGHPAVRRTPAAGLTASGGWRRRWRTHNGGQSSSHAGRAMREHMAEAG